MVTTKIIYQDGSTRVLKSTDEVLKGKPSVREKLISLAFDTGKVATIEAFHENRKLFTNTFR